MKKSDKIELRRLEVIKKLNALNALDTLSDEQRSEETALLNEHDSLITEKENAMRYEAATPEVREQTNIADQPSEDREWNGLLSQIEIRNYMDSIAFGQTLRGVEREVRSELNLADDMLPIHALLSGEQRATAVSSAPASVGVQAQSIIERVFAESATVFLGAEMPSVGTGEALYHVMDAGTVGHQLAKDARQDGTAASFTPHKLGPLRLQAEYLWRREDQAVLMGQEEALRNDLRMVLMDKMDTQVLLGNGTSPQVSGFFSELTAATAAADTAETWNLFVSKIVGNVDGKFATGVGDIKALMGVDSYNKASATFKEAGNPISSVTYLDDVTGGVRSSANSKIKSANKQDAIVYRTKVGRNVVAPVWVGIQMIRDEFSHSDKGQIKLTAVMLWNFMILREAPYKLVQFDLR